MLKRLRILSSKEYENESIDILRKNLLSDVQWFNQILLGFRWTDRVNRFLQQADAHYTLGVYVLLSRSCWLPFRVLAGSLISLLEWSWFSSPPSWGWSLFQHLYQKKTRKMEKFQKQLPAGDGVDREGLEGRPCLYQRAEDGRRRTG